MRPVPIVAVAAGSVRTGIIVRTHDGRLARWQLVARHTPIDWYLHDVIDAVTNARDHARNLVVGISDGLDMRSPTIVVENTPDLQTGSIVSTTARSVQVMLDQAQVIGAVAGMFMVGRVPYQYKAPALAETPVEIRGIALSVVRSAWHAAERSVDLAFEAGEEDTG